LTVGQINFDEMPMIVENIKPFEGQHCEITATGTLLLQQGIELSDPMLFGLGEALGFIFWNMKSMNFPFIGGRITPDVLTQNIARNLNLEIEVKETSSSEKYAFNSSYYKTP
jgi:ethanolamine transporter EutH